MRYQAAVAIDRSYPCMDTVQWVYPLVSTTKRGEGTHCCAQLRMYYPHRLDQWESGQDVQ